MSRWIAAPSQYPISNIVHSISMDEKSSDKAQSENSQDITVVEDGSIINERALMRKVDLRLLPAVTILYLMSFLDRSNGIEHPYRTSAASVLMLS